MLPTHRSQRQTISLLVFEQLVAQRLRTHGQRTLFQTNERAQRGVERDASARAFERDWQRVSPALLDKCRFSSTRTPAQQSRLVSPISRSHVFLELHLARFAFDGRRRQHVRFIGRELLPDADDAAAARLCLLARPIEILRITAAIPLDAVAAADSETLHHCLLDLFARRCLIKASRRKRCRSAIADTRFT
jgi:hypothetical protein